jgi:iron complex outermembrane receptor protein
MRNSFKKTALATALMATVAQQASAQLEEVVVTAQKRSQSMQDVSVAVSAIGGEDIEALGWDRPNDIASQVPNMQVSSPLGDVQPLFSIRGVSMVDYTPSQSSPVGVYIDESYVGASYLQGLSMFDLERVEVLRGPQGTLYGKNTTGGAINLITRTPQIDDETNGNITVGDGDYGLVTAKGAVEGTLSEGTLAGRLAFNYKENDGYYDNKIGKDMTQTDYYSLRGTVNWRTTENFNAVLKISTGDSDAASAAPRVVGTNPGGLNIAGSPDSRNQKYHEGSIDRVGNTESQMDLANLTLNYEMENYSLVSVTSMYSGEYLSIQDTDGTADSLLALNWGSETEAWSQDLRLVSSLDGPINFIVGAYYGFEDVDTDILHYSFFGAPASNAVFPDQAAGILLSNGAFGQVQRYFEVEKESFAVYGDLNWDFTEKLSMNLGLRYTDDENTRDRLNYSRINGGPLTIPGAITGLPFDIVTDPRTEGSYIPGNTTGIDLPLVPPTLGVPVWTHGELTDESAPELSESEGEVTGTLALNYHWNDNLMTYVRYSRGYRAGAFNNGLVYQDEGDDAYANPEFVDSYEVGIKSEFFDGIMRLNGAAFYYDYSDQQFVNQIGVSAVLENAGGVDIYGLELELLAMPTDNLTLQAGLGLIDAEYNELELGGFDLEGNEPVSAPDLNFNLAADYTIDIGENWMTRIHLDGNYVGDQWFSAYNDANLPGLGDYSDIGQDAYWLWNGRVTLADNEDRFGISLWVANMADEEYDVYAINLQGGFGYNYFISGAPRTYGAEFTYRF